MRRIIERAGEFGMVVILGYSYFGQDQRLSEEAALTAAVENATECSWRVATAT